MTPLFPENHTPIIIKQGNANDCYLLTSLDCMLSEDDEGKNLIRSLFTEHPDGSVSVRIKRTDQSINLVPQNLIGKYQYFWNVNEDIFTLNPERLKEIDQQTDGVITNSLAVKILERISSYYQLNTADFTDPLASVFAHNRTGIIYKNTSTEFAGKLLGIPVQEGNTIDEIIKYKTIYPQAAVYLSINYNVQDASGTLHSRHALRIDKIISDSNGEYQFILKNPWDNQKDEVYSLEHIQKQCPRFCIFIKDIRKHQLANKLIHGSLEEGVSVFENLQAFPFQVYMQGIYPNLNIHQIQLINKLQQTLPSLFMYLCRFSSINEHIQLLDYMGSSLHVEGFIKTFLIKIPRYEFLELILQQNPLVQTIGITIKDTAILAKNIGYLPLNSIFTGERFFSLIIDAAITQKTLQLDGDNLLSRRQIESGLVSFYFNTNLAYLTSNVGLRDYFIESIFSLSSIEKHFSQSASLFLTYALANFLLHPASAPDRLIQYLTSANFYLIDSDAFDQMMDIIACTSPSQLDEHLKTLTAINSEFSARLLSLASNNMVFDPLVYNSAAAATTYLPSRLGLFGDRLLTATNDVMNNNDSSESDDECLIEQKPN